MIKEWTGDRSGLRYWVPSIVTERKRDARITSPNSVSRMKEPRHPAFPVEELSKYLSDDNESKKKADSPCT